MTRGLYAIPKNSIKEVQALLVCVYTQIQNKITIACIYIYMCVDVYCEYKCVVNSVNDIE